MRRVFSLFAIEIKMHGKRLFVLLVAVLLLLCMDFFRKNSPEAEDEQTAIHYTLGVCDEDKSIYSALALSYFRSSDDFSKYVDICEADEEELRTMLENGDIDAYIFVPNGFADSLNYMGELHIKTVISSRDVTKAVIMKNVIESYETYIAAVEANCIRLDTVLLQEKYDYEVRRRVNDSISTKLVFTALAKDGYFEKEVLHDDSIDLLQYYILHILFFVVYFLCVPGGFEIRHLIRNRIGERLYVSGMGDITVIVCRILSQLFLNGIILIMSLYLLGYSEYLLSVFCTTVFLELGLMILSLIADSDKTYALLAGVIFVAAAVAGGGIVPVMYLPDRFAVISGFMPNNLFVSVCTGKTEMDIAVGAVTAGGMLAVVGLLYGKRRRGGIHE